MAGALHCTWCALETLPIGGLCTGLHRMGWCPGVFEVSKLAIRCPGTKTPFLFERPGKHPRLTCAPHRQLSSPTDRLRPLPATPGRGAARPSNSAVTLEKAQCSSNRRHGCASCSRVRLQPLPTPPMSAAQADRLSESPRRCSMRQLTPAQTS